MCGRYGRRADKQYIAEHYKVRHWEDHGIPYPYQFAPDYNITPGTFQPVVRLDDDTGERELTQMEWGLVPHWADQHKMISNCARDDKLATSGTWRESFKRRRCLVPVEFFYEWEVPTPEDKKRKITKPWAVTLTDDLLFSFGAIWDWWRDPKTGIGLESFALVTTKPNELLEPFHNRCPLIVEPKDYARWLSPYERSVPHSVPVELIRTYPAEGMKAWRVNPLKVNGPELLAPLPASDGSQPMLF